MNLLTENEPRATNGNAQRRTVAPRYSVEETADAFVITAQVPGVDRSALETQVDGEKLTVSARRSWTPPKDATAIYREIQVADYRLVFEVDHRVNREGVRAELNQGVLTLTLPKSEALKPRRIEIKG
jgi:HSP20 family protein